MSIRQSSDLFALVNTNWVMTDASKEPPPYADTMMICGNKHTGKTVISTWKPEYGFTHWAPLPVFPKD